ncbi:MAG: UDP-4-amino-4,6-dideoxy-N-acetyl-beta-L-altrosamine transaminase [Rhodopirellula baltica]
MLPYGKQSISEKDVASVIAALQSDYLTTGPIVKEFEDKVAQLVGAKHAVAVSNATAALHLAMLVTGIEAGDRVVTSPNTFLASANAAAFAGATPDFADIDPITYNLCPQSLSDKWQADTKAVVAVHYAGQTADMPAIAKLARQNGAVIIEDGCHGIGGAFEHENKRWMIGNHDWADITTFSFHPVKTLTTGEGGMLVTNNAEYANQARLLRTHGMTREPGDFSGLGTSDLQERGPWYYEMQTLGYNYRITDIQCALGVSQLERLDGFLKRRREIVSQYNSVFADHKFLTTPALRNAADRDITSWHLYTLQIDFDRLGRTRSEVMASLRELGIGTQVLYIPVHLQPWYRKTYGYEAGKCPIAEDTYRRLLSLPLYPGMTDDDVQSVIEGINITLSPAA